jgi:hypothetical protein
MTGLEGRTKGTSRNLVVRYRMSVSSTQGIGRSSSDNEFDAMCMAYLHPTDDSAVPSRSFVGKIYSITY